MNIIVLDKDKIDSIEQVHEAFAKELNFPSWYGNNFDALYDLLSERADPVGVIIIGQAELAKKLGRGWFLLLKTLDELSGERPDTILWVTDPF